MRNERFDIEVEKLLAARMGVEPALKDQYGRLAIDHFAAARARHVGGEQDTLCLCGGEPFILLVQCRRITERRAQGARELLDQTSAMPDFAGQLVGDPDHDVGDVEFGNACTDSRHIAVDSSAREGWKRMGGDPDFIGDSQPDRLAADV
jgi:hypothetical protein